MLSHPWKLVSILIGTALIGIEAWGAVEHLLPIEGRVTAVVVGAPIATVALAVVGVILERAIMARKWMMACALLGVFVIGSAACLTTLMDRSVHVYELRQLDARTHNTQLYAARSIAERERGEEAKATAEADAQRKKGGCGRICKDWVAKAETSRQRAEAAEKLVSRLGAPIEDSALAKHIHSLTGSDVGLVSALLPMLMPLMIWAAGLVCWSYGFAPGHKPGKEAASQQAPETTDEVEDGDDEPLEEDRVVRALTSLGGSAESNDAVAQALGVRKGTASKWLSRLEKDGKVRRHRDGRRVRIALVA